MAERSKPKPQVVPQQQVPLGWDQQHPFWAKALDNVILPALNAKMFPRYNEAFQAAAGNEDQMAQQALDQGSRVRSLYHDTMKVMDKIGAGATGVKVAEAPLFLAPPVAASYFGALGANDLLQSAPQVAHGNPEAIQNSLLNAAGMTALGADGIRGAEEIWKPGMPIQTLPFQRGHVYQAPPSAPVGMSPDEMYAQAIQNEVGNMNVAPTFFQDMMLRSGKRIPRFTGTVHSPHQSNVPVAPAKLPLSAQYNAADKLKENLQNYGTYIPPTGYAGDNPSGAQSEGFNPFLFSF